MTVRRPQGPWRGRMQGGGGGSWLCRPHFAAGPEAMTQDRNPYSTIEAAPQIVSLLAVARLGACLTNDRRREGATHASHGRPWMVAPGLRGAGTAQRNDPHRPDFSGHFASIEGTM